MAEGVGIALGVTSLVLELYTRCKNSSTNFHHLHQDLKSFHQTLLLTEHYLPHLDDIRIACEELVAEIEELLSKHASRNLLRRVKSTFEDIQPLRTRLIIQMSALHTSVNMLKDRGLDPGLQSAAGSVWSSRSLSVAVNDNNEFWNDDYRQAQKRTAPDPSFGPLGAMVLESSLSSTSTFDVSSDTLSLLTSTESLVSTDMARDLPSMRSFSNSSSSISSAQREHSLPLARFESQLSHSRTRIVEAAKKDNVATVCNLRPQVDEKPTDNALIAVSRTPKELPFHIEQVKMLLRQGASFECTDSECLRTPLIWAIVAGRKDLVELFLEEQALVETRDGVRDWTPVIWAVMEDKPTILDVLIRKGANLTAADGIYSRTPLIWAIVAGGKDLVELFLEEQALVETRDGVWDWTPVIWAVMEEKPAILDVLIRKGANLTAADGISDRTPLLWAASIGNHRAAELLLETNEELINVTDKEGMTPLALAYFKDHLETAQLIVNKFDSGDNSVFKFESGSSLLARAVLAKNEDFARLLLEHGADAQSTDIDGVPALILAIQQNLPDIARLLVNKGADLEAKDDLGRTALLLAIIKWDGGLARLLLEHGADARSTDMDGVPALILAIQRNLPDIAELLVNRGADVQCTDENDVPALTVAVKDNRSDIADMLIQNEAELEARDGEGNTALLWAVWRNNERLVKMLVKGKANTAAVDGEGDTVQKWAAWTGNKEIVQLVSSRG